MKEFRIAIKSVQEQYQFAVVCVNEVTADLNSELFEIKASLGPTWAKFIHTQLEINKTVLSTMVETGDFVPVRTMKVTVSPSVPTKKCKFLIQNHGVTDKP